ncbi:hypothetical protein [Plantactinospora sp. ZYX-F-223]|uniref:hypothetical protein n=1 Tax=Plantactinospora sp. ZYX-F-223 TaxID=3144103 RepID=UPI0031FC7332
MSRERVGDRVIGAVGAAAGTAADPRAGVGQLRGRVARPAAVGIAVALVVGYLLGRRRR